MSKPSPLRMVVQLTIALFLILFTMFSVFSQVKIGDNPTNMGSSSLLELESTNKALVLTRVANTSDIVAPVNGMIVYDLSSNCIKAYINGSWNCLTYSSNIEPSTNGSAKVNSYNCSTASSGTISLGVSVSGVTQTITADVSQIGTYSLSCSANGVVFSGSGTFTSLGSQNILLTAIGTAVNVGADTYTLNTIPNCSFSRTTIANPSTNGTAIVSAYACNTGSTGTLTVGTPVSGVTQTITATVTTAGTYNISTTNNGVTFAASGNFAGTGAQNIVLTAMGTPTSDAASPYSYTLNTTPNCSFSRTVLNLGSLGCGIATAPFTTVITGQAIPIGYTFSLPYTNGNGYYYPGATITSSSHPGVTASAAAQTLNTGSGSILFTLGGTPATNGTITFNITVSNQSCAYSGITASRGVIFSTVTSSGTTTIPAGINAITIKAWGAAGKSDGGYYGGYGSYVRATVAVTPGENLIIRVGGGGTAGTIATNGGGFNGGGGYSGVFRSTTPLIIAGGGGGCGNNDNVTLPNQCTYIYGGSAGIVSGQAGGRYASGGSVQTTFLNTGGTQTAGGIGSDGTNGGTQYQGGAGITTGFTGGGGGGGYYGGGGGTNRNSNTSGDDGGGGGAGGSSFIIGTASNITTGEQTSCVSTNTVEAPGSADTDYDATNTPAKPKNNSAGSNGRLVILYSY